MSENVLVFELFSGVGWCNQLFSLESAVYLANITNRKLVVFVEHPIAHCGGMNWDYGTVFDYLSDDFKEYLPNGFEYYTKSLPEKYLQDKEGGYLNIKRDVVKWSGKSKSNIGLVLSYCRLQQLWYVRFPDGDYEIEEWCLEVISECG